MKRKPIDRLSSVIALACTLAVAFYVLQQRYYPVQYQFHKVLVMIQAPLRACSR